MSISSQIKKLHATLPPEVQLVAVSKFHPVESLQEAYDAGQRIFGESRAQELVAKVPQLPKDIQWHFIGTLQTNKVREIAPFVQLIHSVDSLKLLQEIDKQAAKNNRTIDVLLEIFTATEETKHGMNKEECMALLTGDAYKACTHIRVVGLMAMASLTNDEAQIMREFHRVKVLFDDLKTTVFSNSNTFRVLSMGMSHDYLLAVQEGSTMVRIGASIFGEREY